MEAETAGPEAGEKAEGPVAVQAAVPLAVAQVEGIVAEEVGETMVVATVEVVAVEVVPAAAVGMARVVEAGGARAEAAVTAAA